ncbi:TonB-dependent vitamin B12 receptor [Photobacterium phosphoreum]|uniref:TonB-dependent vitamin B12 receptor n=1 Tax=Photobacterium phosphoreum TaxID=659 RepID=UPI000D17F448|nr:TonB-dependent vitamin B12 receptor [Photobacterium phosphoreum]MCD9480248.1 TonB-dependent vitamin B12 receptor [Photobacterium phosphoreum]MCD9484630.1 TonB-dependent vitamin B12 receptor [Photobacterium phosphoreum]PSU37410.1 TonB-dependent vitamin B12 receptor [Photobacterium phosphoreum]
MKKSLLAATVASLCLPSFASFAADTTSDDVMVVMANRFEQPITSVLAPFNVVTRQDIDKVQAKTLTEVLSLLPGVQITQNGGRGQSSSIFVRGANSDQVLVLVDGIRMARSVAGNVDFNQIPLTQVQRIEFTRGARAAIYGSEAIGGVINIITLTGTDTPSKTKLDLGIGSHNYQEASVAGAYKIGDKSVLQLAAGYENDKGYNVHPQPGLNDGDKHGFDSRNASLALHHQFTDEISGYVATRWYKNHYQYDGSSIYSGHQYVRAETEFNDYSAGLKYAQNSYKSSLIFDYQKQDNLDYVDKTNVINRQDQYHQRNVQWHNQYQLLSTLSVSGGIDWRQEQWNDLTGFAGNKERDNTGYYAIGLWDYSPVSIETSVRLDDNQQYGTHSTYNIAGGWYLTDNIQLRGSYGTAFKAPNLYQLYVKSAWSTGNSNLNPETSKNIDISLHADYDIGSLAVTAYQMRINDLIDYTGGTPSYENVKGESKIKGIEVEAGFDTGIITHQLNFDFKDPRDSKGQQLIRREKFSFKWVGTASYGDLDTAVTYQYHGKRPDFGVELPAYDTWDIALTYWLQPKLALKGRVANLLNEDYETAGGYAMPGRTYYTSINYQF